LRAEVTRLVNIEKELIAVKKVSAGLIESEISENDDKVINHEDFVKQMIERLLNAEHKSFR